MDCIVVERRAADCTELVLQESAYRSVAEVLDLLVHSVDIESIGFAARIEAR